MPEKELFFKCPRCGAVYSTSRETLDASRLTRSAPTTLYFGGWLMPKDPTLKCAKCKVRLEKISPEEYMSMLDRGGKSRAV